MTNFTQDNCAAGDGYNVLVSLTEHYGPALIDLLTRSKCFSTSMHVPASALASMPLYHFTYNSRVRALTTAGHANAGRLTMPTIPAGGFIADRSGCATALWRLSKQETETLSVTTCHFFATSGSIDVQTGPPIVFAFAQAANNVNMDQPPDEKSPENPAEPAVSCTLFEGGILVGIPLGDQIAWYVSAKYMLVIPSDSRLGYGHITVYQLGAPMADGKAGFFEETYHLLKDRRIDHTPIHVSLSPTELEMARESSGAQMLDDIRKVLAYLDFAEQPSHYIVEESPMHMADRKPHQKAARYDDRERWVLLDPEEVRTKMRARTDLGGSHNAPIPHLRRAHVRTLTSERYKFKRGAVINVRPTWVGDRAWENRRMCYRVVSRLGSKENQA